MRTLEEHRAAVLALVSPLPTTRVPVAVGSSSKDQMVALSLTRKA